MCVCVLRDPKGKGYSRNVRDTHGKEILWQGSQNMVVDFIKNNIRIDSYL